MPGKPVAPRQASAGEGRADIRHRVSAALGWTRSCDRRIRANAPCACAAMCNRFDAVR